MLVFFPPSLSLSNQSVKVKRKFSSFNDLDRSDEKRKSHGDNGEKKKELIIHFSFLSSFQLPDQIISLPEN